ncbi:MAG: ABC transporter permease [Anaerolineae bacterium]|nr:ABC transporter permease [Anaerolineae bacterium]
MSKIWTIAWKDIYATYSDRNLVLVMLAAPLAVATIIALAFGGLAGGGSPISNIPVAIVNLDQGSGGFNYGDIFVNAFIPPADGSGAPASTCTLVQNDGTPAPSSGNTLEDLTEAVRLDDAAAAKAAVDAGTYTAAIIIPADFTARLTYGANKPMEATSVEVYGNGGQTLGAGIIRSIAEGFVNQIVTGNVAVAATIEAMVQRAQTDLAFGAQFLAANATGSFQPDFSCAFEPALNAVRVQQDVLRREGSSMSASASLLVVFGSAQAMFFTLFTGQGGILDIFQERRQGTLQRLIVSPTPRLAILLGKLAGTFVTCVTQLIFLFIALTLVASVLNGGFLMIWGNNLLLVGLIILGAALAATGLGTFIAGLAKTPEQAGVYGSVISIGLSVLGGAFGFQLPPSVAQFSLLYWGTDAFQKLSNGRTDVGLNLLILVGFGVGLFAVGYWLFNRRLDV